MRKWGAETEGEVLLLLEEMRSEARGRLSGEGFGLDVQRMEGSLDLRYVGQSHEIKVPLGDGAVLERFASLHHRLYGYTNPTAEVEVVAVRLRAEGRVEPPALARMRPRVGPAPVAERVEAFFRDLRQEGACVERAALTFGDRLSGPLLVTEYSSTHVVPAGWSVEVDELGNLHLEAGDV